MEVSPLLDKPEQPMAEERQRRPRGLRLPARILTRVIRPALMLMAKTKIFNVIVLNRPSGDHGVIVAPNHCSDIDPFLVGGAYRQPVVFVSKAEVWNWPHRKLPVVGWFMSLMGEIPVDRKDSASRAAIPAALGAVVRHGGAGIMFPEGTTHDFTYAPGTKVLGPIKNGVARTSLEYDCPIRLVGIRGTNRVYPPRRGAKLNRRALVILHFDPELLDPIDIRRQVAPDNPSNPTSEQFAEMVRVYNARIIERLTYLVESAPDVASERQRQHVEDAYRCSLAAKMALEERRTYVARYWR